MIYPQSFPNLFSSLAEEDIYTMLSRLGEDKYASYYETELNFEKTRKFIPDFIVVDKNHGVLILEVTGSVFMKDFQVLNKAKAFLKKEFKDLKLTNDIGINVEIWEHSKYNTGQFGSWLEDKVSQNKTAIADSDYLKICQYLKRANKYYTPSGKIQSFNFQNFKGIKKTSIRNLPSKAPWIFITGENGFGKTCLLQAIALSLYGQNPNTSFDSSFSGSTIIDHDTPESFKPILKVVIKGNNDKSFTYKSPKTRTVKNFRNVCAYGASRLDTYDKYISVKNDTPILSLFSTKSLLRNIELSLVSWYLAKEIEGSELKYEKSKELLEKLLDGIEISISPSERVWYKEKKYNKYYEPINFKDLAAGYRSMIAMVGDIMIRLFDAQPDILDPAELEGIVIIDELDLHWHPKWQKKLPALLSDLFPLVQFIASTHSPVPLLGAPEYSVFLKVNRTVEEGITVKRLKKMEQQIKNLLPNIILTSPIFDMDDITPITNKDITSINVDDSFGEEKFYTLLEERVEKLFSQDKFSKYDPNKKKHK